MCPSYQRPLPRWAPTHPNIKGSSTNQTRPRRQTSAMANKRTSHRATVLWEVSNRIVYSSPSLSFTKTTLSLPYFTALMVMLVSGMHIGWGICCPQIRYQEWHLNTYPHEYIMVILSWFLGAIIGSIMTLYVYTRFTKREIYVSICTTSCVPVLTDTSAFIVVPFWRTLCGEQWPIYGIVRQCGRVDNRPHPGWNSAWPIVRHRDMSCLGKHGEGVPWHFTLLLPLYGAHVGVYRGRPDTPRNRAQCRHGQL